MMQTATALYSFFSGFGWPVYPEDAVPGTAEPPYITVKYVDPTWEGSASFYARVWDRSASPEAAYSKADEIKRAIGAGACVPVEGGAVWIYREANFAQRMPFAGDPALHCVYLSMSMQANIE